MKLSHSATPTFSAEAVAVLVLVRGVPAGTGELALVVDAAFRFVSYFAQASTNRPTTMHNIKRRDLDMLVLLVQDDRARR
jgi:hypothetical protein